MAWIVPVRKGGALDSSPRRRHLYPDDPAGGVGPELPPVKNLWNSSEASEHRGDLGQRVYSSRLLGRDASLVLHGGGNTSVKTLEKNIFGEDEAVLQIKGSGWDLATIEADGFSPCRMQHLMRLSGLSSLSDLRMAAELKGCMTRPSAPAPSVEAILHAILPAKYVDHTHADAFISVSNTPGGEDRVREIYGDRAVVIPYVMPGFKLARACALQFPRKHSAGVIGIVLMNHGLVSFGETAEESYGRMIELVTLAEEHLARNKAWAIEWPKTAISPKAARIELATFRRDISVGMGAQPPRRAVPRLHLGEGRRCVFPAGAGNTRPRHPNEAPAHARPRPESIPRGL